MNTMELHMMHIILHVFLIVLVKYDNFSTVNLEFLGHGSSLQLSVV